MLVFAKFLLFNKKAKLINGNLQWNGENVEKECHLQFIYLLFRIIRYFEALINLLQLEFVQDLNRKKSTGCEKR